VTLENLNSYMVISKAKGKHQREYQTSIKGGLGYYR